MLVFAYSPLPSSLASPSRAWIHNFDTLPSDSCMHWWGPHSVVSSQGQAGPALSAFPNKHMVQSLNHCRTLMDLLQQLHVFHALRIPEPDAEPQICLLWLRLGGYLNACMYVCSMYFYVYLYVSEFIRKDCVCTYCNMLYRYIYTHTQRGKLQQNLWKFFLPLHLQLIFLYWPLVSF